MRFVSLHIMFSQWKRMDDCDWQPVMRSTISKHLQGSKKEVCFQIESFPANPNRSSRLCLLLVSVVNLTCNMPIFELQGYCMKLFENIFKCISTNLSMQIDITCCYSCVISDCILESLRSAADECGTLLMSRFVYWTATSTTQSSLTRRMEKRALLDLRRAHWQLQYSSTTR